MFNDAAATGPYFRRYIYFQPAQAESLSALPEVAMSTAATTAGQPLGTIPDGEFSSWTGLYANTKLHKVIVKYTPAQTMGVTNVVAGTGGSTFAAQDAVMYSVPVYDNVDQVIDSGGVIQLDNTEAGYSKAKVMPYARRHSIYRPWTRVLSPTIFQNTTDYPGTNTMRHKVKPYIDISGATSIDFHGLYLTMPAIRRGGETDATTTPTVFPALGARFILGKLTFTYVQFWKTRQ